jgi:hypothetical protein
VLHCTIIIRYTVLFCTVRECVCEIERKREREIEGKERERERGERERERERERETSELECGDRRLDIVGCCVMCVESIIEICAVLF